jgi:phage shock protein A
MLRDALHRLEQKIAETKAKTELLVAQHRRARLMVKAGAGNLQDVQTEARFDRARMKVADIEALGLGHLANGLPNAEQRLLDMEKADQVDRLLADLKMRALPAGD